MIVSENSWDMCDVITLKAEKEALSLSMIGLMYFREVRSSVWQWLVFSTIGLCSPFSMSAPALSAWMFKLSCTTKQKSSILLSSQSPIAALSSSSTITRLSWTETEDSSLKRSSTDVCGYLIWIIVKKWKILSSFEWGREDIILLQAVDEMIRKHDLLIFAIEKVILVFV